VEIGYEARIAPEIKDLAVPIHRFNQHPENPRKHKIGEIQQSLLAHGQRTPIVVQKSSGFIVKGNGTHEAAEALGWLEIAAVVQDMDDDKAMSYLLADNRTSDQNLTAWDRDKTVALLEQMVAGPAGLTGSLFSIDELEDLIAEEGTAAVTGDPFAGGFNETPESRAAREAQAKATGSKRREIPLTYTVEDHARFVGWLKVLQKRWGTSGTMVTVYEAVRRQVEAEEGGVIATGDTLSGDSRALERYAALKDLRDLMLTLGTDRDYKGTWVVAQIQGAMAATGVRPGVPVEAAVAAESADSLPDDTEPEEAVPDAAVPDADRPGLFDELGGES